MKAGRKVFFYCNHFQEFYKTLDPVVKRKVDWVISLVCELEIVPSKFLKHLQGSDSIYEIRVSVRRNIYRIFCFFDKGNLIIVLHGFHKKTQKTPKNEILKAEKLKREYYEQKK